MTRRTSLAVPPTGVVHVRQARADDLAALNGVAERIAIETCGEMIRYIGDKDITTRRIPEGILAMEEHADDLSSLREDLAR